MSVVTDWEATRFEHQMSQGRTKPIVLGCRRNGELTVSAEPKLVKAMGMPEIVPRMLVAETVGNAVARIMGVPTAEPCIVNISEKMANSINANLIETGSEYKILPGPASGCTYFSAYAPVRAMQPLTAAQSQQALLIYLFDMLSQNPDRRLTNPNCAVKSTDLLAFDFGDCFAHLWIPLIGGAQGKAWQVTKHGLAKSHLFYGELKRLDVTVEYITWIVERISDEWFQALVAALPPEWKADAERIRQYVAQIRENAPVFASEIQWSLQ